MNSIDYAYAGYKHKSPLSRRAQQWFSKHWYYLAAGLEVAGIVFFINHYEQIAGFFRNVLG